MPIPVRLSTSPPNNWDGAKDEAAYYCDLCQVEGWKDLALLGEVPAADREEILRDGLAAYVVAEAFGGTEIGLLILVRDDVEGIAYRGIDHLGRVSPQPAANEALWTVANAAQDLPAGHRITRGETFGG